jgi:thioredoxin 1
MKYDITDASFKEETKNGVSVVDMWATWCGPCRMQAPIIEQLSEELDEDEVRFLAMDVDENPATPQGYGVMAIPTLLFMKNGEVVRQEAGVHTKAQIKEILAEIA